MSLENFTIDFDLRLIDEVHKSIKYVGTILPDGIKTRKREEIVGETWK